MSNHLHQNARNSGRRATAAALGVQSTAFWLVLAALGPVPVAVSTWLALHGLLAIALVALFAAPHAAARWRARTWLAVVFYAVFFAACFAGANFALDALHGPQRLLTEVAPHLGGLELWHVLCPGLFSFATGAVAHALLTEVPAHTSCDG